jgi:hypothetical protein
MLHLSASLMRVARGVHSPYAFDLMASYGLARPNDPRALPVRSGHVPLVMCVSMVFAE